MIPSIPRLSDYDVSAVNGFLPTHAPCERLSDPYYAAWEGIIQNLQGLLLSKRLRPIVDRLPVLDTAYLQDEAEWRRAYAILSFIVHAYVWGGDSPNDRIPPAISIPFLTTCQHLELPPVATYASTVMWNWKPLFSTEPVDNLENVYTLHTFTGSLDESWFYLVSVAIESRGAPIIPLMLEAIEAARMQDTETVVECLRRFAERLDELGSMLVRMYENCDPHVFYNRIRPYLAGSKNMVDAGLPNGVLFDTGSPDDDYVQYSGGSNAQSSIIQFFDIALGIEHRPTGEGPGHQSSSESESNEPKAPPRNFITDMRQYMPGPHRRFLEHMERIANIREYVYARKENRALSTAYDACLAMLRTFRDKHIQMVSRYIILKSREVRRESATISPAQAASIKSKVNLATASRQQMTPNGDSRAGGARKLRGTGGTALIPFLKQARDETGEPAIDAWARRLLNDGPGAAMAAAEAFRSKTGGPVPARMSKMGEHASGEVEIVGLAGVWGVDDSEGGICHW